MSMINKNLPIASVILLTYNSENYIRQTLDSIISQVTSFSFQIIICDDCSVDNTREIVKIYQDKHSNITLIFNEKNLGIIGNFKKAITNSQGKYIAYCGHDDFWQDNSKLQKQVDFLEANPDFGLVHTDYNIYNEITKKTQFNIHKSNKTSVGQGFVASELIYNYYINSCTPCFRKDIFEKYVPIDDFIKLNFPVEDWATYVIIAFNSKVGYISESMGTFRIGHESASNQFNFDKVELYLERSEIMFEYLRSRYKDAFSNFNENSFKVYKSINLLSAAYKLNSFKQANYQAEILKKFNYKNLKVILAKYRISFYLYVRLKSMAVKFS